MRVIRDGKAGLFRQLHDQADQQHNLGRISLRAGHGNFRTGSCIQRDICRSGNGGSQHIGNCRRGSALFVCQFDCRQCIGRFSGLRHKDAKCICVQFRRAVTEFTGRHDKRVYVRISVKQCPGIDTGMISCPAGNKVHPPQPVPADPQRVDFIHPDPVISVKAPPQGLPHSIRLFMDFLHHETVIPALLGRFHVIRDMDPVLFQRLSGEVRQFDAARFQDGNLAVIQRQDILGQGEQACRVTRAERRVTGFADNHRVFLLGNVYCLGIIAGNDAQGKAAFQAGNRRVYRIPHTAGFPVVEIQQVHNCFGIRLGRKDKAFRFQIGPQFQIVLNDAVMNYRNCVVHVVVRMGIEIARDAMGSPAGMTDPAALRAMFNVQLFFKNTEPALLFPCLQFFGVDQRNPGRIIAAVLQLFQTLQ